MNLVVYIVLIISASAYKEDNNLLILQEVDFPLIFQEYTHLVVLFYAPWCGYCKKLAPYFKQIAAELKEKRSNIKLAKVDATTQTHIAQKYEVSTYPTLKFFIEGNSIPYNGQPTKEDIMHWIERKLIPAVVDISTERELKKLSLRKTVSVVYFGSDPLEIEAYKSFALADDSITYFNATGRLLSGVNQSFYEIHRNFDKVETYTGGIEDLQTWIHSHSKPYIVQFESKTIRAIFAQQKPALVFFNVNKDTVAHQTLSQFAKNNRHKLIFTQMDPNHEHFSRFADYLSLDTYEPRILIIESGAKNKIMYKGKISELSQQSLTNFIASYEGNFARKYGITDSIAEQEL